MSREREKQIENKERKKEKGQIKKRKKMNVRNVGLEP